MEFEDGLRMGFLPALGSFQPSPLGVQIGPWLGVVVISSDASELSLAWFSSDSAQAGGFSAQLGL